ncbi:MAG: hypothetical protein ACJASQ_001394 [Crocinitomicaceae bacterium]|jgi:hypothetical protein
MPLKLLIASLLFLIAASCTPDVDVEEEVSLNLKKEFKKEKIDLKKELNKLERFLVEKDVLSSKSSKSKRAYLKFVAKNDSFPILENFDDRLVVLNSPLDLQFLASAIKAVQKSDKEDFKGSELKALLDCLESGDLDKRSAPKTIAQALLKVDSEEFKKPLFRAMTLILIASSMSDHRESKDWVIKDKEDYKALGYGPFEMGYMMICDPYDKKFTVSIKNQNQLLILDQAINDINLISDELTKYFTINRGLTKSERELVWSNPKHKGYNYPFYSLLTLDEAQNELRIAKEQIKEVKEMPGVEQDFIEYKQYSYMNYHERFELVRVSTRKEIQEINFEAVIEIEFMDETSEPIKEKVYEELFESIYALRNKESIELFGEDFETIQARQNIFLNDFNKLRLIEASFPVRIMENPGQFYPSIKAEPPTLIPAPKKEP